MRENKKKIENLILFFASQGMLHLGKKKLAKLLYFVDFTNYELREKPITGFKYMKWDYGPIPEAKSFYGWLEKMNEEGKIDMKSPDGPYIPAEITANEESDLSVFSEDERKIIFTITEEYKNKNASTLEQIAKDEPPYIMVKNREEIPYHLAFYRNSFDEMSINEENSVTS